MKQLKWVIIPLIGLAYSPLSHSQILWDGLNVGHKNSAITGGGTLNDIKWNANVGSTEVHQFALGVNDEIRMGNSNYSTGSANSLSLDFTNFTGGAARDVTFDLNMHSGFFGNFTTRGTLLGSIMNIRAYDASNNQIDPASFLGVHEVDKFLSSSAQDGITFKSLTLQNTETATFDFGNTAISRLEFTQTAWEDSAWGWEDAPRTNGEDYTQMENSVWAIIDLNSAVPTPEPSILMTSLLSLGALAFFRRRTA